MRDKLVKFYDIAARKSVKIPESKTHTVIRHGRNRVVKMLAGTINGKTLYKIVGQAYGQTEGQNPEDKTEVRAERL